MARNKSCYSGAGVLYRVPVSSLFVMLDGNSDALDQVTTLQQTGWIGAIL